MTDQCSRCELMGNYEGCKAADCGKHSDWITVEHKKRITELEAELAKVKGAMRGAIPADAPVLKMLGFHRDDDCANRWNDASGKEIIQLKAEIADRHRRHAADVEERDRKIAELRAELANELQEGD